MSVYCPFLSFPISTFRGKPTYNVGQLENVKDKRNGTIAKNCRARDALNVLVQFADWFYDRLMVSNDTVHHNADIRILIADNDNLA